MSRFIKFLLLALPFVACDNNVVSRTEYDAAVAYADSLKAQNEELQFEISDLKLYSDYLEKTLGSLEHQR